MKTQIIGTGSYVPEKVIDNPFLQTIVETDDEWIVSRTGIRQRRIADEETTVSMCVEAAKKAMEDANVQPEELDLIIVATVSGDRQLPAAAFEVQREIGAIKAMCFDLSAACSGFMYALTTASAYIESGMYRCALVIGGETLSKIVDWTDRSTCILFGDGAGACVVSSGERGILGQMMYSDGTKGMALRCDSRSGNNLSREAKERLGFQSDTERKEEAQNFVAMDGQEVYRFAVTNVPQCIGDLMERFGYTAEDIDCFLLHQANERIIRNVARRLHAPIEKFPMNLSKYGNTSAASIPILLDEVRREGRLKPGDKVIISGFGGGLSWGAILTEWTLE